MKLNLLPLLLIVLSLSLVSAFNFGETSTTSTTNNIFLLNNDTEIFHNNMSGIQGGVANEYYHIRQSWYNELNSDISNWITQTQGDALYYGIGNPFGYYNSTDFSISNYFTKADINGFGYYNSTDFSIGDYSTTTQMNTAIENANTSMLNYVDGTFLTSETDPYWTANQSSYSTKAVADTLYAPINYGDDWNKTYADTLYADISVTGDNSSWNKTYADTLYADISVTGGNSSWNESLANTLYSGIEWDYNQTTASVNILNGTGLIKDWNSDGYIKNWNTTGFITNQTQDLSSYSTTAEILAFGYYNSTDFIITDYFTKTQIENFNYYNSSDFSISDYLTSAEILAFNYYNSSDFDITNYFTSAQVLGFSYYNSTDFVITDYYTKTQIDNFNYYNATDFSISNYFTKADINGFGYYNATNFVITDYFTKTQIENFNYYNSSDFSISDYATNVKVDSLGNFSAYVQPTHLTNFTDNLGNRGYTSNLNFTNGAGYYNLTDFSISDYYLKSNPFSFYNSTDFSITDYTLTATIDGYSLSHWADDLGNRGYTHLTNFSDNLGNRGYTDLVNFTNSPGYLTSYTETDPLWTGNQSSYSTKAVADTLYADISITGDNSTWNETYANTLYISGTEADLNVNSSDYWDNLGTINTTQMENNGGTLNILTSWLTTFFNNLFSGKTTDDLSEGSTNLYDNSSWNKTHADTLYADISVVNLTEDDVEAYIFDNDNTANLNMSGYNITEISYSIFCNGANCWKMYVNASDYFIIEEI